MTEYKMLLSGLTRIDDHWHSNPGDDWRQGRTLFGGLSAALCFEACAQLVPDLPPLRSAQIAYVGPSAGAVTMKPAILRRGKSVTFMGCDLMADDAVATRALFCFGGARESAYAAAAPMAPAVPGPEDCQPLFPPARGPIFTQHIHQHFAGGHRPMSGADRGEMFVWVRLKEEAPPPSLVTLIALADALPPASMPRLTTPAMISTMTWQLDIVDPDAFNANDWVLIRATDDMVGGGYSGQSMALWNRAGQPLALARQTVALFA